MGFIGLFFHGLHTSQNWCRIFRNQLRICMWKFRQEMPRVLPFETSRIAKMSFENKCLAMHCRYFDHCFFCFKCVQEQPKLEVYRYINIINPARCKGSLGIEFIGIPQSRGFELFGGIIRHNEQHEEIHYSFIMVRSESRIQFTKVPTARHV